MKKFSLLTMLGILSISACTGLSEIENTVEATIKKEVTITATHEFDYQTRTVLQEDGSVWWKPNDAIGVFFGTYCSWFVAYNMEDAPTANFIGEAIIVQGHNENSNGNAGEYTYWGVFPPDLSNDYEDDYDEDFSYWKGNEDYEEPTREKESVNVYLPAKQKGVAGTFDSNLFISIAKSNTYKELSFYNLCGGLAFCVEKEGIHTVTFKGNADEVLAGGVNVVVNSDNHPVVNEVRNGKKEVKLTLPKGEYFVPGEWYYIVMLPTSLEEGYSMTFYTDREMGTVVSSKPVEIKRSVFGKLTNPDSEVEYTEFIPVESVEIRTESYNEGINIGDTLALTAVITPSDCTFPAVWSSSDPSVATVDENGNVVGVSEGEARITLTVGDMSDYRWVYVYGNGNENEKVPSFTITSIDLTDVYAITSMYKEEYDGDVLYTINEDGTNSIMKFILESDNDDFKRFVEENVALSCYTAKWLTDEYLALEDPRFVSKADISYAYSSSLSNYFTNSREYMIFRVEDGKVFSIDEKSSWILHYSPMFWRYNSHILYQPTYYLSRKLYNSDSIYFHDDETSYGQAPVYRLDFNGNKITGESVMDFSGSQFRPNFERILVDKNNNLLTYDNGIGYILCSDKSIIPFNTPELADHDVELGTFFEVDHTWYYWTGTRYWYDDYYRHYATLYKVTLENKDVVFTELTSTYRDQDWWYSSSYYRRGNTFIFGYEGNYVVIDMNDISVSHVSVEYHDVETDYITPDGYYYSMEDGVVYKYDLLSGTPTAIPTDRSQVPPMTPTSPYYDSTNHCYVESGTRLSDSVTITIVTDAETGKVIIYEGEYENASLLVKLP